MMALPFASFPRWVPAYDLGETIDRVGSYGFDGIEIAGCSPHLWPEYVDDDYISRIRKRLDDNGMEVSALCPPLGGGPGLNPASANKKERDYSVKHHKELIQIAAKLGCEIVLYIPGWIVFPTTYEQAWDYSMDTLVQIAEEAEKTGILLGLEPLDLNETNLVVTAYDSIKMMKQSNSKNVKLMMDTYHIHMNYENPIDYIKLWKDDLVHVHISDCDRTNRLVPGKGHVQFKPIIDALKKQNYNRYLSVEVFGPEPDEQAYDSYQFVKSLL